MINLVPTLTWHMEMKQPPVIGQLPFPEGFHVAPFKNPGRDEYLKIYKAVGGKYSWFDRLLMSADELEAILNSDTTSISVLKYGDEIAGFVELNLTVQGEAEIVYFGITEKYTGKKAGFPFLMWAVNKAWDLMPGLTDGSKGAGPRVWLHTCDLDHPAAFPLYQKAGFIVYKEVTVMQPVLTLSNL